MEERRCKQCERALTGLREDAKFCQKKCRNKYNKRRQRILDRVKVIEKRIRSEQEFQSLKSEEIENINIQKERIPSLKIELEKHLQRQSKIKQLYNQPFDKIKPQYFDQIRKLHDKKSDTYLTLVLGNREEKDQLVHDLYDEWEQKLYDLKFIIRDTLRDIDELDEEKLGDKIASIESRIQKSKEEETALAAELKELQSTDLNNLPSQPDPSSSNSKGSKSKINRPFVQGLSGDQILKMDFNGVKLRGELGNFFGHLQRDKCAIALTGDAGVGKSTFSFEISKLFVEKKLSVAYFALETGISKSVQKLIAHHDLGKYDFKAFGEGSLNDVRYHAGKHDCVVIDSYSKISSKPEDFEDLRQDFPDTFFVIIFQKTTDGKIRGGSSIFFNCTASIDLQISQGGHRLALMQKSRYDTENFVYSIDRKKLLKSTKIPIKWSEIKERWDEKQT
ncbi:MAG: hypothetical protein ACFHU9_05480 [Fluviicola sp.]